jgi:hypothetical protein
MKRYILSFAAAIEHKPEHPERTARRPVPPDGWDVEFQVWNARAAMARAIRMQQKRERRQQDWRACVPLSDTEGYGR